MSIGFWAAGAHAAELVRVGGYDFPPFVEELDGTVSGLAPDLITALNTIQKDYQFRFVSTASRRRYADLQDARYDIMFFESPEWGWTERALPVDFSGVYMTGGEVYVASARPGRGQDYFNDLTGKRMVGILGYHYGFAGFSDDPQVLTRKYNTKLVGNHRSSLAMVLADRMDVAVVTDAYLGRYFEANPDQRDKLLISKRYDQVYNHRVLVRRGGPISVHTVNDLLAELKKRGVLDEMARKASVH